MRTLFKPSLIPVAICGFVSAFCKISAAEPSEVNAHWKSYSAAGEALQLMVNSKKIEMEIVNKRAETMIADAQWVANEYLKLKPEASKWFKVVFENLPTIRKMPYEEIEKNWHDGRHFEGKEKEIGIDPQDEKNEHFRDPLDAVTHVLLVQRSAEDYISKKSPEPLRRMKSDLAEGLEQMRKAVTVLGKK